MPLLEKDSRFKTNFLTLSDKERLFRDFAYDRTRAEERDFTRLLESCSRIEMTSSFEEAKPYISGDPRYGRLPEETRERLFEAFMVNLRKSARDNLVQFFKSVVKITAATPTEGAEYELLLEMLRVRVDGFSATLD